MAASKIKCAIWGTEAYILQGSSRDGKYLTSARTGGSYFISRTTIEDHNLTDDHVRALLTTWLIDQRRVGVECPEVMTHVLDDVIRARSLSVHERADRLLIYLGDHTSRVGGRVDYFPGFLNDREAPSDDQVMGMLAWSESCEYSELGYLIDYLVGEGWIQRTRDSNIDLVGVVVTVAGYQRLSEIATKQINVTQAFVAMWFDKTMDDAYSRGIAKGISDAGYKPFRVDKKDHNNKIDDEIIAEIRRSRFIVADFTQDDKNGARGGVYYEAGFAQGLNIPLIFTCRKDAITKVHFDTRQYNHITWTTPEDLADQLAKRISATIGDGPLRKAD